jgi:hypothetical protein
MFCQTALCLLFPSMFQPTLILDLLTAYFELIASFKKASRSRPWRKRGPVCMWVRHCSRRSYRSRDIFFTVVLGIWKCPCLCSFSVLFIWWTRILYYTDTLMKHPQIKLPTLRITNMLAKISIQPPASSTGLTALSRISPTASTAALQLWGLVWDSGST